MTKRILFLFIVSVIFLAGHHVKAFDDSFGETFNLSDGTYEIFQVDDFDPLWRFTKIGDSIQLETDPSITSWGSDYWGYWSDPFELDENEVYYVAGGLTETTYEFVILNDGGVDVIKTLVVHPYLGGNSTTTITHPGQYQLIDGPDDPDNEPPPDDPVWVVISYEDFEGTSFEWQLLGRDARIYRNNRRTSYAYEGSSAVNIQDNSGLASTIQQYSFDAAPYSEIEIDFWFYAVSMENGENFRVQFENGYGEWVTIVDLAEGRDFENNRFYNQVLQLSNSEFTFSDQVRFRIQCDASNNYDDVYIDEIKVSGLN